MTSPYPACRPRKGPGPALRRAGLALLALGLLGTDTGCSGDGDRVDGAGADASGAGSGIVHRGDRGASWFTEITDEVGLAHTHHAGGTGEMHIPEIMGAGVTLADLDGDGDLDVYLPNGASGIVRGMRPDQAARFEPSPGGAVNRLFRREADGTYVDVTESAGVGDPRYSMGCAVADVDNDGDVDLYVTNVGRDRLYRNHGDGTFTDATDDAGIDVDGWSTSAAFVDVDHDGFLDLYVCRYLAYDPGKTCTEFTGKPDYCGPKSFPGVSDVLLRNRGDGTFEDVSERAGLTAVAAAGLGVVAADVDDDGWIDVYVANDGDANQLWMNDGDGTFTDAALFQGVALNWSGVAEAGMGVIAQDLDGDLDVDLFMTHLADESNTFYANQGGDRGFLDRTAEAGLETSSVPYTGFGTAAFDADLDGDLDLLVANGRVLRREAHPDARVSGFWADYAEPNLFYLGDGAGRFAPEPDRARAVTDPVEITRGLAVGDVDDDGDLDLLVASVEGPARLYRNDAPRTGAWLRLRVIDPALRRDAIGARVVVALPDGRKLARTVQSAFSYLSASDPRVHVGLGPVDRVEWIEVRWPDGALERFTVDGVDRDVTLSRGAGVPG